MKRCPWFGAALLLVVGGVVVLTLRVSPLYAQDRGAQVEAAAERAVVQPAAAKVQNGRANGATHRVSYGRVGLPGDTRVTSPITFGLPNAGAPETGGARRRGGSPVYQNVTLGGAITADHDMMAVFRQYLGQVHTLSITILSARGDELSKVEAAATMVEVSLDLEARTWQIMFKLESEE